MRSTRRSEKMDNVKTNDQQWYGVVPDSIDVWTPGRSACPRRGTPGTRACTTRAGCSAAPRLSVSRVTSALAT